MYRYGTISFLRKRKNPLDVVENLEKGGKRLPYDPDRIRHQIAQIQNQEHQQEPRKKHPEILDRRVDTKLKHIPNGV